MSAEHDAKIEELSRHFLPINSVSVRPPTWVIPGLIPPGMTLLVGDPKTFKSRLVLHMCAAITQLQAFRTGKAKLKPSRRGTAAYFAAEQSAGTLRHIYETKILKRKLPDSPVDWSFITPRDALEWQIDEPMSSETIMADFIEEHRPTLVVIDPLINFHSYDENDPQMIRPLVPLRKAVLKYGGALVVVHHARKDSNGSSARNAGSQNGFSRARGTSALWGMADAGIMATKLRNDSVNLLCEFKEFPPDSWTWRPEEGPGTK